MKEESIKEEFMNDEIIRRIAAAEELVWINPKKTSFAEAADGAGRSTEAAGTAPSSQAPFAGLTAADIQDASDRLRRFAPLLMEIFPETKEQGGIIESELTHIPAMKTILEMEYRKELPGRLYLKRDSDLAVAGSVKARGGIYEVLKHSEELALEAGLLSGYDDDYTKLAGPKARAFFAKHKIQVGSTGNLGVSIGMAGAGLGFQTIVHMSADARQWKKDYLRAHGVTVIEYAGDYGKAVAQGREESDRDPMSYFVDDENSKDLFLGYAVAAERLDAQFAEQGVRIDEDHPLFVYIPCGVGGAPGGVAFGLKMKYGDNAHIFFIEPTQACCMLLGLATGLHSGICVQDVGLTGMTEADGLAVGRPSGFAGRVIEPLLSGEMTLNDGRLYAYLRDLWACEGIFIEPSACAAFEGVRAAMVSPEFEHYIKANGLEKKMRSAVHLPWATGGRLVPAEERLAYLRKQ